MSATALSSEAVPDDFPQPAPLGALPGHQAKMSAVLHEGRYYAAGNTPPERLARYRYCKELAHWFAEKCTRNELGKYKSLTRLAIIEQYHRRLQAMRTIQFDNLTAPEATWVMQQCAAQLGWPSPWSLNS